MAKTKQDRKKDVDVADKKGKGKKGTGGYEIQQGETLSQIAQKHHTTVSKLCKINKISKKKMIHAGQKIKVD